MKFFVYGGTGLVSGKLIELLLENGHSVIAGTRNPSNQKQEKNLDWVAVDALDAKEGVKALEKVDAAFLLSPPGYTNQYDILYPFIAKAKEVKLKKIEPNYFF